MELLQTHLPQIMIKGMSFITMFGEELILVALLGTIYWSLDKNLGKRIGTIMMVGLIACPLIKNVVMRRRPYFDNAGISCLDPVDDSADLYDIAAQGYSFPSGHSTNAATCYGGLFANSRNKIFRFLMLLVILLIGFSRIVLGNHYPTDVLCGWLLGAVIVVVMNFILDRIRHLWILYALLTVFSLSGFFYCTSDDYYSAMGLMIGMFAGFVFEEKVVNFENTQNPLRCVLRVAGGLLIFVVLNAVLKMPFSKAILDAGDLNAHLIRVGRYFADAFVVIALYPMIFRKTGQKKKGR